MANIFLVSGAVLLFVFRFASGAALDKFFSDTSICESHCNDAFSTLPEYTKACGEGCRLFKIIGLSKGFSNETSGLCFKACTEAFSNYTIAGSCNNGCRHVDEAKSKNDEQTIHLLLPLFHIKNAYNTMAHHVRQFVSSSLTVYVQEDSGSMVVLESKPKIERIENVKSRTEEDRFKYLRNFRPPWETDKVDWMDCISHTSGLPKFILVLGLFGFIVVLIWLCCATAVTAPHHYMGSHKDQKRSINYVLLCEPNPGEIKPPTPFINNDEEAPPLPPKVSLI